MPRFAIVTNDLQVAAATKHPARKAAVDAFLPRQIALLSALRQLDVPVIHLQLVVADDDPRSVGIPSELQFARGSVGVQILPEVLDPTDVVLEKPKDSGFFQTDLDEQLRERGVDTVVITGMQTQICVQTTAADAHFRGYGVIVPSDGVVSSRPEDTAAALRWLADYCATVMTSEQVVEHVAASLQVSVGEATR